MKHDGGDADDDDEDDDFNEVYEQHWSNDLGTQYNDK
jgi:hypothetical protein